jgi:predicted NBD/HSP70 family sugar kinase
MPSPDPWIGPRGGTADRLLQILRAHGPLTRPQVARLTGMSLGGIRPLVSALVRDGHLVETPDTGPRRGPGRPGTLLTAVLPDGVVLGLDFGHAHVRVAAAGLDGVQLADERAAVDVDHHADDALDTAARLARSVLEQAGRSMSSVRWVVAGVPGPVGPDGRLSSSTIVASWASLAIAAEVAARLSLDAALVDVENDAHLGALGEQRSGAARGVADVVYVKASHGLGAGLVLQGELYRGARGLSGELGHTVVEPDGELCRCGGRGCLETIVAIAHVRDKLRFVAGDVDLDSVGDHPAARRIVVDVGRTLGRALADVCTLLDVERIVLGGELAAAGAALVEGVSESIRRYAQPPHGEVEVVLSELGERAQVTGATALAAARARAALWSSLVP